MVPLKPPDLRHALLPRQLAVSVHTQPIRSENADFPRPILPGPPVYFAFLDACQALGSPIRLVQMRASPVTLSPGHGAQQ